MEVLEDNEDAVLNLLMQDKIPNDSETVLCSAAAKYCDDLPVEDDYVLEEHEELWIELLSIPIAIFKKNLTKYFNT